MKRMLIFSLAYYPHVGGAEVAVKEITDRIADIEFHMVTMRFSSAEPREEKVGKVFVHRIGNGSGKLDKFLFQFSAARKASALHKQYQFDGIWAIMAHSSGVPAGVFKTFHPEVKYLLTLQEGDPPEYVERLMRPLWPFFKRGFTTADMVAAESTFLGRWARRRGFTGPMEVIPNGMDAERFARMPSESELETIRTNIGKKGGETWLIHTGRLVHKNALDVVIRALPLLPAYVHFFMLGDGPDKSALTELAEKLGVASRVHFHPYVPLEDIPNYLKACDIFIRPSRSEGMGNSFIEAMAAGLPVIATQEGGIADFLFGARRDPDKETTGWAVDKDSPKQIAEAVQDILAHSEQVARVEATAKKLVFEKYHWDLIGRSMQNIFGRLLGR
ncbi:glycosyltransferase family 4 protein [Patescibacteria group bacterium]|nr:glycosyltransferase family 4 protein [Patescibacteria group bacterium]